MNILISDDTGFLLSFYVYAVQEYQLFIPDIDFTHQSIGYL